MPAVIGVDGCKSGWLAVRGDRADVYPTFTALLAEVPGDAVIGVDMPIGLHDEFVIGGRDCDRAARALLAPHHARVFSAPCRRAFGAETLAIAQARGCRMTLQALNIMAKVEDIDGAVDAEVQRRVHEAHPELAFLLLNGGRPLPTKHHREGRVLRRELLASVLDVPTRPHAGEHEDDLLDACAAWWIARRIVDGTAQRVPDPPPVDSRGLRMEIWF